jgi:hypothetical protein
MWRFLHQQKLYLPETTWLRLRINDPAPGRLALMTARHNGRI